MHAEAFDGLVEGGQGFADGGDGEVGQGGGQVGQVHARGVRGEHGAEFGRCLACNEVPDQLARRAVGAAAQFEGLGFPFALEVDAGQDVLGVVDFRRDPYDDAGVGVAFVARVLAHAVGDDAVGFGRCRHDRAARAHTEAVDGPPVAGVVHQFVIRGAQDGVAGVGAEAGLVDEGLRVFDAEPDRERLGFHEDALVVQHLEGVARAMAHGQHDVVGLDMFAVGERDAGDPAIFALQRFHFAGEAHFAAQLGDGVAHDFDHADQAEGADVRFGDVQDFFGRAGQDELLQHFFAVVLGVFDLAVELAVGEGAGAAFAELYVRFGVQDALAPQAPGVFGAFAHGLAAFQDDGLEAHLRQDQSGEQATGAGADDDGALGEAGGGLGDEFVFGVRRRLDVAVVVEALEQRCFILNVDIQRVGQQDIVFLARVVAAQEDGEAVQVAGRNAQFLENRGGQFLGRVVQRQLDFRQAQHAWGPDGGRSQRRQSRDCTGPPAAQIR
ncbi:hypothetical protein D3C87_1215360 [compost metagenome]